MSRRGREAHLVEQEAHQEVWEGSVGLQTPLGLLGWPLNHSRKSGGLPTPPGPLGGPPDL